METTCFPPSVPLRFNTIFCELMSITYTTTGNKLGHILKSARLKLNLSIYCTAVTSQLFRNPDARLKQQLVNTSCVSVSEN